jgi:NAD(P)-dependent dehydrogenase (short-subunit alcohol dehydrogenase family)
MKFEGNVAIVTGGAQGIGKGIAKSFLEAAMKVVIADIDEEAGKEAEEELARFGEVLFVHTDVASEPMVRSLIERTVERWHEIDILVNNAGIASPGSGPLSDLTLEAWNRVISVNLTGAFLCAKYALPYLKEQKGVIINIASTRALMSEPNTEAYSASKGGIVALTHAMAASPGPDIRVNCISPGWIDVGGWRKRALRHEGELTEADHAQHLAGRVGMPSDVAELALFLASPEASFITAANFIVDGGMTRKMIY